MTDLFEINNRNLLQVMQTKFESHGAVVVAKLVLEASADIELCLKLSKGDSFRIEIPLALVPAARESDKPR